MGLVFRFLFICVFRFLFICVLLLLFVVVLSEPRARDGRPQTSSRPPPPSPVILLLAVPRRLYCFGSMMILDVTCCYLWLFLLYISIKIGKNGC